MLLSSPLRVNRGICRRWRIRLYAGVSVIMRGVAERDLVRASWWMLVVALESVSCLLASPLHATQDSIFHYSRRAMGTTVDIFLQAPKAPRASELFEAAFAEIEYVDATLSNYIANSEISRINATAAHVAITVDPELFGLLQLAAEYGHLTGGAFDITVGPLIRAWGFFGGSGQLPSPRALTRARSRSGWTLLELGPKGRTVRFRHEGVELDLGAIGKGWALDRAANVLRRIGVDAALLGAGRSSYYAIGAPAGRGGWPVHVRDPADTTRVLATVLLHDGALATSGATQRFFESEGHRYSHIIDPRTGLPVEGMLQVTVTASTATDSDVLSTALFVLGPNEGAELLAALRCGALFVRDAGYDPRVVAVNWPDSR